MSFQFDWPQRFPPSFVATAKNALEQALNAGQKLSLVADRIRVVDLNMGSIPPELDILSLDELSGVDASFRGTFMLSYSGDALISLAANLHVRVFFFLRTDHHDNQWPLTVTFYVLVIGKSSHTIQTCFGDAGHSFCASHHGRDVRAAHLVTPPPSMRDRSVLLKIHRIDTRLQR